MLVVQSWPPPQGPQRYIGRWLGCTPNPNLWTPLTHDFLVMAHLIWRATNVRFFIVPCILCQSEICVGLRQFWTAKLAAVAVASAVASAVVAAAAVDTRPGVPTVVAASAVNTRRGVWICRKWYAVPPQYPQNADRQLRNDQAFCTELQGELKTALFGMFTNNPTVRGKPRHANTRLDFQVCLL